MAKTRKGFLPHRTPRESALDDANFQYFLPGDASFRRATKSDIRKNRPLKSGSKRRKEGPSPSISKYVVETSKKVSSPLRLGGQKRKVRTPVSKAFRPSTAKKTKVVSRDEVSLQTASENQNDIAKFSSSGETGQALSNESSSKLPRQYIHSKYQPVLCLRRCDSDEFNHMSVAQCADNGDLTPDDSFSTTSEESISIASVSSVSFIPDNNIASLVGEESDSDVGEKLQRQMGKDCESEMAEESESDVSDESESERRQESERMMRKELKCEMSDESASETGEVSKSEMIKKYERVMRGRSGIKMRGKSKIYMREVSESETGEESESVMIKESERKMRGNSESTVRGKSGRMLRGRSKSSIFKESERDLRECGIMNQSGLCMRGSKTRHFTIRTHPTCSTSTCATGSNKMRGKSERNIRGKWEGNIREERELNIREEYECDIRGESEHDIREISRREKRGKRGSKFRGISEREMREEWESNTSESESENNTSETESENNTSETESENNTSETESENNTSETESENNTSETESEIREEAEKEVGEEESEIQEVGESKMTEVRESETREESERMMRDERESIMNEEEDSEKKGSNSNDSDNELRLGKESEMMNQSGSSMTGSKTPHFSIKTRPICPTGSNNNINQSKNNFARDSCWINNRTDFPDEAAECNTEEIQVITLDDDDDDADAIIEADSIPVPNADNEGVVSPETHNEASNLSDSTVRLIEVGLCDSEVLSISVVDGTDPNVAPNIIKVWVNGMTFGMVPNKKENPVLKKNFDVFVNDTNSASSEDRLVQTVESGFNSNVNAQSDIIGTSCVDELNPVPDALSSSSISKVVDSTLQMEENNSFSTNNTNDTSEVTYHIGHRNENLPESSNGLMSPKNHDNQDDLSNPLLLDTDSNAVMNVPKSRTREKETWNSSTMSDVLNPIGNLQNYSSGVNGELENIRNLLREKDLEIALLKQKLEKYEPKVN